MSALRSILPPAGLGLVGLVGLAGCGGHVEAGAGPSAASLSDAAAASGSSAGSDAAANGTGPLCVPSGSSAGDPLYVLKSFLIDPSGSDPGWNIQASVSSTTPASSLSGLTWTGNGHFVITADKIQLLMKTGAAVETVLDAWGVENVEVTPGADCASVPGQPWTTSPWVGWHFAKSDASDVGLVHPQPSSTPPLLTCLEMSATIEASLAAGSFTVDEATSTMSWRTVITAALACPSMGPAAMTANLDFVFVRP
jgi:hypothetical protein